MKRKGGFFRFLLLVIDIALAVWIWNSYKKTQAEAYVPPQTERTQGESAQTAPVQTETAGQEEIRTQETPVTDTIPEEEHVQVPSEDDYEQYPPEDDYEQYPPEAEESWTPSEVVIEFPPEVDDFSWYLDGVMLSDVPDGAVEITDYSQLLGHWECMVYRDPEGTAHAEQLVFYDAIIDIGQSGDMLLVLDRTKDLDLWTGELNEYQNLESDVYALSMEDGLLRIDWDGGAAIYLYVYAYNGGQYGIGVFESADGFMCRVAAFRK